MKAIILLQSIIILLGAYYIYTLSQAKAPADVTPMIHLEQATTTEHPGYVPPTGPPPTDESLDVPSDATTSTPTGPSDAGMEYPVPDPGIQVQ